MMAAFVGQDVIDQLIQRHILLRPPFFQQWTANTRPAKSVATAPDTGLPPAASSFASQEKQGLSFRDNI